MDGRVDHNPGGAPRDGWEDRLPLAAANPMAMLNACGPSKSPWLRSRPGTAAAAPSGPRAHGIKTSVERANRPCSPEDLKKGDGFANCGEYWAAVERADNVTGTLKAKEQAQREELAKRAAAEEEARERWRQAQANTYTWSSWSYSYDYSYTYYPQSYYYYYYVPRRHR